jgi:beta-galactosidase beta subunit
MILDSLDAMDRYNWNSSGFSGAFEYLRSIDADAFSSGKREVIGIV